MPAPRPSTSSVSAIDFSLIVYLGAVWGAAFLFFHVASREVGPVWTAELRVALAGLALLVFTRGAALRTLRRQLLPIVFVGATFSAIPFTLLAYATLTLPASLASVLMATTPLFTALVGAIWLRQRLTPAVGAGLALGFGAVAVLVGGAPIALDPPTLLAFGAGVAAAFSYAVAGTFVRRRLGDVAPLELATGQLLAAAAMLLPVAAISGPLVMPSPSALASLVAMAIVSTAIAWPAFFRISRRSGATAASTVTFVVPMFGIVWGGLFLGEATGPELVAGFGLVLVSLILVLRLPIPLAGRARVAAGRSVGRLVGRGGYAPA
jgi:drug/metabolite transporter (DMT)-like permease